MGSWLGESSNDVEGVYGDEYGLDDGEGGYGSMMEGGGGGYHHHTAGFLEAGKDSGGGGGKQVECGYCGKTFQSIWYLNRHAVTHTREKNFKCDLCSRSFGRNDNLLSHKKTVHYMQ